MPPRPAYTMREALNLWRDIVVRGLQNNAYDLSTRQTGILLTVYLSPPPHTVKTLSDKLLISKPAVCRAIDALARKGLIKRKRDEKDSRIVHIQRTVKGSVYLSEFAEIINDQSSAANNERPFLGVLRMNQEYFIISGKNKSGPYDLVMLVRKFRNGSLTSQTQIELNGTIKSAKEWPALTDFFNDRKDDTAIHSERGQSQLQNQGLIGALKSGWYFLQRNQISTVLSAVFLLMVILCATLVHILLPDVLHTVAYLLCFIFSHFLFSCYLFAILRMTRGQPADTSYLLGKILPAIRPLLLASVIVSFPAIIGLVLLTGTDSLPIALLGLFILTIPGILVLTIYIFTPLIIIDQGYGFWDAMEMSRRSVMGYGFDLIGVLFALLIINFIAGLAALIPIVIALPVTMSAVTEIYDEVFG